MPSYSGVFTLQAQMQAIAANNWPAPPPTAIGQAYGGGYYAGQIGVGGVATHYLVIGPKASAQSTLQWKTEQTLTTGTDSVINGPANTTAMIAAGGALHPCGQFCDNLTVGGYSDWYMPAQNEVEVCFYNLKPTTGANNTSSGINPNAVPVRASTYTSGDPAQTSVAIFQTGNAEAFDNPQYWASTQFGGGKPFAAQYQTFSTGFQNDTGKVYSNRVRAVRRVAV